MNEIQLLQEIRDLLQVRHPANENMDIEQSANYLGIGKTFLRELIVLYKIPYAPLRGKKGRGRVILRKVDLDEFRDSMLVRSPKDQLRLQDGRRMRGEASHV